MGSFSFLRADKKTKRKNLTTGDKYKILIPKEFGGGFIVDTYYDYGYVFYDDDTKETADLYGILAYWNKCEGMVFDGEEYPTTMKDILERGKFKISFEIGIYVIYWNIRRMRRYKLQRPRTRILSYLLDIIINERKKKI